MKNTSQINGQMCTFQKQKEKEKKGSLTDKAQMIWTHCSSNTGTSKCYNIIRVLRGWQECSGIAPQWETETHSQVVCGNPGLPLQSTWSVPGWHVCIQPWIQGGQQWVAEAPGNAALLQAHPKERPCTHSALHCSPAKVQFVLILMP